MKTSRFTENQIIKILKEQKSGLKVKEIYRMAADLGALLCRRPGKS